MWKFLKKKNIKSGNACYARELPEHKICMSQLNGNYSEKMSRRIKSARV